MESEDEAGWPGALPDVDSGPRGGNAWGCVKAMGVALLLAATGIGVLVFAASRVVAPAGDAAGRLLDGLGEDESGSGTGVGRLGPGDGTTSLRLPVLVSPADALADRAMVTVVSDAFTEAEIVGVTLCDRAVLDRDRGVTDSCDLNEFATFAVPRSGPVVVPYDVQRIATVGPEAIDCASSPDRCVLVLADMDDYQRSGFASVSFAAGPIELVPSGGPRRAGGLEAVGSPAQPLAEGAELTVTASGFVPGEPLQVSVCGADFATAVPTEACAELHDINWYLGGRFAEATQDLDLWAARWHADAEGRATVTHPVAATFLPFGPGVGDVASSSGPAVDCTVRAGACSVVVAAAADPTRAAVVPYELVGG